MIAQRFGRFAAAMAVAALSLVFAVPAGDADLPAGTPPGQQQQQISPAEAFAVMAAEAEKGSAPAMLTLGTMYERGIGTPRNFVKALEWYSKAAAANLPEGHYNVGVCYEIGMGNAGDPVKAFEHFEKSAELELPQGLYKLASLYFTGAGVARNESWGVELLKRAAETGHMAAANDLGVIHFEGSFGQPKDINLAYEMFDKAAELGNPEAMKNLAVFHRDGLGRPVDPIQELKWYTLAHRGGFPPAALNSAIARLKAGLTGEQVARAEGEADAWVTAFRARQPGAPQPQTQ